MTETNSLEEIRARIDEIDREMLTLFCRRMELAAEVAAYKRAHGLPTLRPEREQAILERAASDAPPELSSYARRCFDGIMGLSREYQDELRNKEAAE